MLDKIQEYAMAKINLGLDVTGRRPDGYHEVRMIMQTIDLCDCIEIQKTKREGTKGHISLTCDYDGLSPAEDNLAWRAAALLMDEFAISDHLHIHLQKRIPIAAGLAGGSADAAAVLRGINRMYELGLSKEQLCERGVLLGADVPYCIMQGTALAEGIGERLTRLLPAPDCFVLLAKPGIGVSTKWVYETLDQQTKLPHPDIDGLLLAIRERDVRALADRMGNVLELVTEEAHPVIGRIKEHMEAHGALRAMMSGSGPTVFGLFEKEETAHAAMEQMQKSGLAKEIVFCRFYWPAE